jgi:hypothetical protein
MAVTPAGTPYVESSDNVADYPGVSLSLANHIDGLDGGKVLQVVNTTKLDTFTTTSTSYVDVTGLSVAITPSSVSSKILVIVSLALASSASPNQQVFGLLVRNSTGLGGTAVGNRPSGNFYQMYSGEALASPVGYHTLDSPSTTSSTTYKIQLACRSTNTASVNITNTTNADNAFSPRLASSITVMEIGA